MRPKRHFFIVLLLLACSWCSCAHADIHKVVFNAFTQNEPNTAGTPVGTLRFAIEVADTTGLRPPEAVDWEKPPTITLVRPSTTVPVKVCTVQLSDWQEWSDGFYPTVDPAKLLGGTSLIGVYTLSLYDKSGRRFVSTNSIASNTFLPVATITATPSVATPTLTWTKPTGALYYRILLKDKTWGEPVYWYPKTMAVYIPAATTASPSYSFPPGVLMTGHVYSVRIEARDNDKDLGRRSRSAWSDFTFQ